MHAKPGVCTSAYRWDAHSIRARSDPLRRGAKRTPKGWTEISSYRRLVARAWNSNVGNIEGWPAQRLMEPPSKTAVELSWADFPEGLRRAGGAIAIIAERNGERGEAAVALPCFACVLQWRMLALSEALARLAIGATRVAPHALARWLQQIARKLDPPPRPSSRQGRWRARQREGCSISLRCSKPTD
jgi:hypothetical protein